MNWINISRHKNQQTISSTKYIPGLVFALYSLFCCDQAASWLCLFSWLVQTGLNIVVFVQHKHDDFDATPLGSSDSSPIHEPLSSGESTERYWMIDLFEGMCSTHTTNCGPCAQLSTHTMRLKDRCWYTKYSSFPGHYWIDNKLTVFTTTLQILVCHVIRHFFFR